MKYKEEFFEAEKVAREVGIFLADQRTKEIELSVGRDIKLRLDKISEEKIIDYLSAMFDHGFLAEEGGLIGKAKKDKPYWIVDPIDGTLNFSRDFQMCCVSIALWKDHMPIFGVIYDFNNKDLFKGYVGENSFLNNKLLRYSNNNEIHQSIVATGIPSQIDLTDEVIGDFTEVLRSYKKVRMIGSAALSIAYVASGKFDTYLENGIKIWDVAAGVAILSALGVKYEIEMMSDDSVFLKAGNF